MEEIWKPIPGYDGYEVSNTGKVKSYKLELDMSRGKPSKEQLSLSNNLLKIDIKDIFNSQKNLDYRNYGNLDGILEMKKIFSDAFDSFFHRKR